MNINKTDLMAQVCIAYGHKVKIRYYTRPSGQSCNYITQIDDYHFNTQEQVVARSLLIKLYKEAVANGKEEEQSENI